MCTLARPTLQAIKVNQNHLRNQIVHCGGIAAHQRLKTPDLAT
jgi:hypothetical protein